MYSSRASNARLPGPGGGSFVGPAWIAAEPSRNSTSSSSPRAITLLVWDFFNAFLNLLFKESREALCIGRLPFLYLYDVITWI